MFKYLKVKNNSIIKSFASFCILPINCISRPSSECSSSPSPGQHSTYSSPSWGKLLVLLVTLPLSSVLSSSFLLLWVCNSLGKATQVCTNLLCILDHRFSLFQTMWIDFLANRCRVGTSLTSCTAS